MSQNVIEISGHVVKVKTETSLWALNVSDCICWDFEIIQELTDEDFLESGWQKLDNVKTVN